MEFELGVLDTFDKRSQDSKSSILLDFDDIFYRIRSMKQLLTLQIGLLTLKCRDFKPRTIYVEFT